VKKIQGVERKKNGWPATVNRCQGSVPI